MAVFSEMTTSLPLLNSSLNPVSCAVNLLAATVLVQRRRTDFGNVTLLLHYCFKVLILLGSFLKVLFICKIFL